MTISDPILFDSNVLIYNQNINDPLYKQASDYHEKVIAGEAVAVISTQNITEFFAVITNPARVTKPLSPDEALVQIQNYLNPASNFSVIYPNRLTVQIFQELQKMSKGNSQRIFDVFLVATMLGNNIQTILTANTKDFAPYAKKIKILDPTCGSGSFLVAAFGEIVKKYEEFTYKPDAFLKMNILKENILTIFKT